MLPKDGEIPPRPRPNASHQPVEKEETIDKIVLFRYKLKEMRTMFLLFQLIGTVVGFSQIYHRFYDDRQSKGRENRDREGDERGYGG